MTYKELCDGTLTMAQFWKAKKQAEFFEWVEDQQYKASKKKDEEVRYFD